MIKRIGDGSLTNIWSDRWIPKHFDARPLTPRDDHVVSLVSDLVTASGQWNEQLIRETFISVDPAAILRIPLRPNAEDWWAWESEKHGEYSVKTAYRKLADAQQQGEPTTLGGSGDASWNRIWKLNVPPKVKVFWWRVLHEFLPAKLVLYQRHIEQTTFCDLCGTEQESIQHILIHCTVARVFWREFRTVSGLKLWQNLLNYMAHMFLSLS
jgi:hypothetical protein